MKDDRDEFLLNRALLGWAFKQIEPLSDVKRINKAKEIVGSDNAKTLLEKLYDWEMER